MSIIDREPRHLVAEELQPDVAVPPRGGCIAPLLAGLLGTVAIGMCIPLVASAVLGLG